MPTISEIRHANLLRLIADHGSIQAFADAIDRSHSQVSQLKNRSKHSKTQMPREVGDDFARHVEDRLRLPRGWMDVGASASQRIANTSPEVAHGMSHLSERLQAITPMVWEDLMLDRELPPLFSIDMNDDSMAPRVRVGDRLIFDRKMAASARAGDGVLVRDLSGQHHFRQFRAIRSGMWEAHALNPSYASLGSEQDGLTVVAVLTAVEARWS